MCKPIEEVIQYWQVWRIIDFLRAETMIKVDIYWFNLPSNTFLPGVCIDHGVLCVDPWLVHPGDLLHEAGHIVTVPLELRPYLDGQIGADEAFNNAVAEYIKQQIGDDESPDFNGLLHFSDDPAAGYWSYLVLKHLGLPEKLAFEQYPVMEDLVPPLEMVQFAEVLKVLTQFSCSLYCAGLLKTKLGPIKAWDIALLGDAKCLQQ